MDIPFVARETGLTVYSKHVKADPEGPYLFKFTMPDLKVGDALFEKFPATAVDLRTMARRSESTCAASSETRSFASAVSDLTSRNQRLTLRRSRHRPRPARHPRDLRPPARRRFPSPARERLPPRPAVASGLEVFLAERAASLEGLRIGLIANAASVDARFASAARRIAEDRRLILAALFGPEHGVTGGAQDMIAVQGSRDAGGGPGLPIHSLYGDSEASLRPTASMLEGIDVLVADLQDVGSRYYTFAATIAMALEEIAPRGGRVIVLDRPNPIGGSRIEGPGLEPAMRSFVGYIEAPIRHGLTMGELLTAHARRLGIERALEVVPMRGWRRSMDFEETGLPWIAPSPNMPAIETAVVYPGACLVEATNLSEGRGTTRPFEWIGAPCSTASGCAPSSRRTRCPASRSGRSRSSPSSRSGRAGRAAASRSTSPTAPRSCPSERAWPFSPPRGGSHRPSSPGGASPTSLSPTGPRSTSSPGERPSGRGSNPALGCGTSPRTGTPPSANGRMRAATCSSIPEDGRSLARRLARNPPQTYVFMQRTVRRIRTRPARIAIHRTATPPPTEEGKDAERRRASDREP
jgi:uncharacterized protein YbbC (DUF1343 family)